MQTQKKFLQFFQFYGGRKLCALTAAALLTAASAAAEEPQEKTLSGAEVMKMLSGNSAVYEDGAKQFFGADGSTFYQASGRPVERGTWRVSEDQYCSRWGIAGRPSPEACYTMRRENGQITWNQKYPAVIREGDIFNPAAPVGVE